MNTTIGYVVVAHVHESFWRSCLECRGPRYGDLCPLPQRPGCRAVCVRDPKLLEQHPDCQEYQRKYDAWVAAHWGERPNGRTSLGPLHYFSDCPTLVKPGKRRSDTHIVSIDAEIAQALRLGVCKECQSKMAPFEKQLTANAREPHTSGNDGTLPPCNQVAVVANEKD